MKKITGILLTAFILAGCTGTSDQKEGKEAAVEKSDFQYQTEQFADLRILRYKIGGWDRLNLNQKKLVYYLVQAGLEGRDIMWNMNYRHNLAIRNALEDIVKNYQGDKESAEWSSFMIYVKRVWFSNGIHHHYSNSKFIPEFSREYFDRLLSDTNTELPKDVVNAMFDPEVDQKKVNRDPSIDFVLHSAVNFFEPDITIAEVEAYYAALIDKNDPEPVSYGLNSKIVRDEEGNLKEEVYSMNGMYGPAIKKIISWLVKAVEVAENEKQAHALELLIEYYKSGNLKTWDAYNVAWVTATGGDIDYINSFIEVYNDPLGYKGSYETIVQINDFEASERMKVVSENVQWFEDNAPIMDEHKKANVTGVSYKVVTVAGEAGDASPSTPIGVNLPNANWIRVKHGSKSVSLGNIIDAYNQASGSSYLEEFAWSQEEIERGKKYGSLAGKMHTALHEVVGHASGQINPGVGTPKETLKSYRSALEEARADLVSLYYIIDEKLVELGLAASSDMGKAAYDSYIRNGMMVQLRRIEPGDNIEQSHMRNRQLVASWAYEKGMQDNVIEKIEKDGKTYFAIHDYNKLRDIFGKLLREIQRIKSEGDYEAGKNLIETYGVIVDQDLLAEVRERSAGLHIAPYSGFINPRLVPVMNGEEIVEVNVEYPVDFTEQMLEYAEKYSNL